MALYVCPWLSSWPVCARNRASERTAGDEAVAGAAGRNWPLNSRKVDGKEGMGRERQQEGGRRGMVAL